jgi:flagellar protein FlaG
MDISKVSVGTPAADAMAVSAVARQARSASAESEAKATPSPTVSVQRTDIRPKSAPKLDPREMQQRLQEVVDEMNSRMRESNRNLAFGVDSELNRFVIKVTSRTSGELVRQIPGEAVLAVAHSIEDLKGVLYEDFV